MSDDPRQQAIDFLRRRAAGGWFGRDPYDDGLALLDTPPGKAFDHTLILDQVGVFLDARPHGQFVRLRAILEADVWEALGDVPALVDEPLASRKVVRR